MSEKRRYELKKRGQQMADTRRRIVEATVELHRTVGPGATQISEIADRAGVRRVTVYSHFPDESSLLAACSTHWRALHPTPDPALWMTEGDPARRLRRALAAIYGWYRETEPMTANVLRDMQSLSNLREIIESGLGRYLSAVKSQLFEIAKGPRTDPLTLGSALAVALDFHTWKSLSGLTDEEASDLAARFVELAATPK